MVQEYSPKIIGFCCHWCSSAGADLAGAMRLRYPPNIRIIQVPCTGRIASEGPKFAAVAQEMTERAYRLGPNPVKRKVRSAWLALQPASSVAA